MKTHTIIALLLFYCFTYGQTYTDNDSYSNVEFYQDTLSFTIYPNPV